MRCKTCHYSLTGLSEHRCPECGAPFDLGDPNTFDDPSKDTVTRTDVAFAIAGGWAVASASSACLGRSIAHGEFIASTLVFTLIGTPVAFGMLLKVLMHVSHFREPARSLARTILYVVSSVLMVLSIMFLVFMVRGY